MKTDIQRQKNSGKRMTGEERRAQIAGVAARLFAENGFKGTTTREIAKAAGISEAVIFKHFSKKEELYRAIINSFCKDDGEGQSCLVSSLKGLGGRKVFSAVAEYLIAEHQKDTTLIRLLYFSALEKHEFSEIFTETKGMELLGFLEGEIKRLIKEGEMRKANPAVAARAFLGMVLHFSISQELYGMKKIFKWKNEMVVKNFVDIFFEGMRRR